MSHVAPAVHELEGNLIYDAHGLSPYWALGRLLFDAVDGGSHEIVTTLDAGEPDEEWTITLAYQKGGIAPRPEDAASERLYEFRVHCEGRGQRKADFLVQPRFEGMAHYETGDPISTPWDHADTDEAINVRTAGSNLPLDTYTALLPEACQALAHDRGERWQGQYFAVGPHEYSNITSLELYVRVLREYAKQLVGRDGIMHALFDLLAAQEGSEIVYDASNRGPNANILGYRHTVQLVRDDVRQLGIGHQYGKQIKLYHPEYVREGQDDDALYHPKLGALFKRTNNVNNAVPWSDRRDLEHELEETLVNLLSWAGVPVEAGEGGGGPAFVPDDHFDGAASQRDIAFHADPTPEIEATQEARVVRTFRELTDADIDTLDALLADGGEPVDRHELAERSGNAMSTLYRCLQRAQDVIESDNGQFTFASQKVYDDVQEILATTEDQVEAATEAVARLADMGHQTLAQKGSAFQQWMSKYAVSVQEHGGDLTLKVAATLSRFRAGNGPWALDVLEEARGAWLRSGGDVDDLEAARIQLTEPINGQTTWRFRALERRLRVH